MQAALALEPLAGEAVGGEDAGGGGDAAEGGVGGGPDLHSAGVGGEGRADDGWGAGLAKGRTAVLSAVVGGLRGRGEGAR